MPTTNELLAEFDDPPFTEREFHIERAELERRFLIEYGVEASEIDRAIKSGVVEDHTELAGRWLSLRAMKKYIDFERPPKPRRKVSPQSTSRDSGSFYFRALLDRVRRRLYCWRWMRSTRSW